MKLNKLIRRNLILLCVIGILLIVGLNYNKLNIEHYDEVSGNYIMHCFYKHNYVSSDDDDVDKYCAVIIDKDNNKMLYKEYSTETNDKIEYSGEDSSDWTEISPQSSSDTIETSGTTTEFLVYNKNIETEGDTNNHYFKVGDDLYHFSFDDNLYMKSINPSSGMKDMTTTSAPQTVAYEGTEPITSITINNNDFSLEDNPINTTEMYDIQYDIRDPSSPSLNILFK